MRCMVCERYTFSHICKPCQSQLLVPDPQIRTLENGLKVLSFFSYDKISFRLKTKHSYLGYYIYKILASKSMHSFAETFTHEASFCVLPIDDSTDSGYAHTAILAKALGSKILRPQYKSLHSQNRVSYSGKDLAFRKANPREFKLLRRPSLDVILVDDIVTSGSTLTQAYECLDRENIETMMALTLADANR